MLKTNIYVDGFNLYFGCLKSTPYKWLDIRKLCSLLLTNNHIHKIKYFTAPVSARPEDPQQPVKQQVYLRALRTIPGLEIICGQFKTRKTKMPLVNEPFDRADASKNHVLLFRSQKDQSPMPDPKQHLYYSKSDLQYFSVHSVFDPLPHHKTQSAYVLRTDEKGSDVNLATHLLYDAFTNDYEAAVVISDDSDLYESMRLSASLGKVIGLLNPQKRPASSRLKSVSTFFKQIRANALSLSLFPPVMTDKDGQFHKPDSW